MLVGQQCQNAARVEVLFDFRGTAFLVDHPLSLGAAKLARPSGAERDCPDVGRSSTCSSPISPDTYPPISKLPKCPVTVTVGRLLSMYCEHLAIVAKSDVLTPVGAMQSSLSPGDFANHQQQVVPHCQRDAVSVSGVRIREDLPQIVFGCRRRDAQRPRRQPSEPATERITHVQRQRLDARRPTAARARRPRNRPPKRTIDCNLSDENSLSQTPLHASLREIPGSAIGALRTIDRSCLERRLAPRRSARFRGRPRMAVTFSPNRGAEGQTDSTACLICRQKTGLSLAIRQIDACVARSVNRWKDLDERSLPPSSHVPSCWPPARAPE